MPSDPNSPALLTVVPTEAEAAVLIGYLGERGIKAFASGGASPLGPAIFAQRVDVQIVVRQVDLAKATELLDQIQDESLDEDGDDAE